jgi:hypothetical protein
VRLTEAPSCVPDCVAINKLHVSIDEKELTLVLSVHANAANALALPKSEFWRPEKLLLGETSVENKIESLVNYKGWIYIPIAQGLSTITLWVRWLPLMNSNLNLKISLSMLIHPLQPLGKLLVAKLTG